MGRPQLVDLVQTRAMAKRSQAQQQEDDKATEESEVQITSWDNIPTDPVIEEEIPPDETHL